MKICKISYLAGLVDADGSVGYFSAGVKQGKLFTMEVTMTSENVIDWLCKHFGGTKTFHKKAKPHYLDQHRWKVKGKKAKILYKKTEPFMLIKTHKLRAY